MCMSGTAAPPRSATAPVLDTNGFRVLTGGHDQLVPIITGPRPALFLIDGASSGATTSTTVTATQRAVAAAAKCAASAKSGDGWACYRLPSGAEESRGTLQQWLRLQDLQPQLVAVNNYMVREGHARRALRRRCVASLFVTMVPSTSALGLPD